MLLPSRRSNLVLPFKQRRAREVFRLPISPVLRGRRMDFPCQYEAPKEVGLQSSRPPITLGKRQQCFEPPYRQLPVVSFQDLLGLGTRRHCE